MGRPGRGRRRFRGGRWLFLGAPWRASCTEPCRLRAAHPSCVEIWSRVPSLAFPHITCELQSAVWVAALGDPRWPRTASLRPSAGCGWLIPSSARNRPDSPHFCARLGHSFVRLGHFSARLGPILRATRARLDFGWYLGHLQVRPPTSRGATPLEHAPQTRAVLPHAAPACCPLAPEAPRQAGAP